MNEDIKPQFAPCLIGKNLLSPHDDEFAKDFPLLYQLLWPTFTGKAMNREPGVISIRVDGSVFRVTLVCPTEEIQTTMETTTMMDLLEQLERHVNSLNAVWVPTYEAKTNRKKALDLMKRKK